MVSDNPTQGFANRLAKIAKDENAKHGNRWDILIYVRDTEETPAIVADTDTTRKSSLRVNFEAPEDLDVAEMEIHDQIRAIKSRNN